VRELGEEIVQVRHRLDAIVVELDRRRHRVTNVKRHLRRHARSVAVVGVLIVAALAVAPVVVVGRRASRRSIWSRKAAKLRDRAHRLRESLAPPPPPPTFGPKTLVAIALSLAQIVVPRLLAPQAEPRPVTRPSLRA
jgi:hypothetical protein